MEQLLLFALLYERVLANESRRQRTTYPPAEPLEPILWHRMGELRRACVDNVKPCAADGAARRDWQHRAIGEPC